jgi:uncharacterized protein YjeT (DUF2065 family)
MKIGSITVVAVILSAGAGCIKVGETRMRVRDPSAVGVVADGDGALLLPPHGPPTTVVTYENFARSDSVTRSPAGGVDYTLSHSAPTTGVDRTPLVDADGRVWSFNLPQSIGPLGGPGPLVDTVRRGEDVRLRISQVIDRGPLETCVGTPHHSCLGQPAVSTSLATESRNVRDIEFVREPLRLFGYFEVPAGVVLACVGVVDGAVTLRNSPSDRNVVLALDLVAIALGGLMVANGLWYLVAPQERTLLYRTPE